MSNWLEQPIGTTAVPIELVLNDADGGVAGEDPYIRIRRITDNAFLDFSDNTFKLSGHTQKTQALTDRNGGRYSYTWNSSLSVLVPTTVVVEYTNEGGSTTVPGIDSDVITFSKSAAILESIAKSPLASVGDGPGGCRFIYTLTVAGSLDPISDAIVYVTSDLAGSNIIAGPKVTDEEGKVTFYLNSGSTYYFWRNKGGYAFTNPDKESF